VENEIVIYTKFCLECIDGEGLDIVRHWAMKNKLLVSVVRTTYRPKLHEIASKIYGNERYTIFAHIGNEVIEWSDLLTEIKEDEGRGLLGLMGKKNCVKKKPVVSGKKKGVKK
jgi:hypothetical protein